ncbi:hypothetical protein SH2C18_22610 [Clostridium sediminicola]|uniref:hypothetical protein n=1 Tax=Clostridium sediminicola TaxID=3114879 RepID=UPI0031F219D9
MIAEYESIIKKIDGIINVKIIQENDDIKEVHILANRMRSPKQIVRDIESCLIAAYDYRIDRKTLSIAQIQTDDTLKIKRIKLDAISIKTEENVAECTVNLSYEGNIYGVTELGVKTLSNRYKLIARSTIKAVEKITGHVMMFDIQDVEVNNNRNVVYANVFVNMFYKGNEELLIGASIDKNDINVAICKATLDAINRKIEKSSSL